ncbi:MAG TPA: adenylate/guanylate cyclase domain-containing protein [Candidatus Ozemobacteraceae bacterium]|nr:adenylate/guanylate cyclase domain-containing protein [Candidatus Ozemobacteraceae bacterium]
MRTLKAAAGAVALAVVATALLLVISAGGVFSTWALDWFWRLNGPLKKPTGGISGIGDQVVIVAIDEPTLRRYRGERPRLPRDVYARIITQASQMGARLIGFDVTFDEPGTAEEDRQLAEAARTSGTVVTNCYLANNENFSRIWISGRAFFREHAKAEGFADFPLDLDRDKFIRRVRLYYPRGDLPCRVSFAIALYLADIGQTPDSVLYERTALVLPRPGGLDSIRIPLDHRGLSLVGFLGGAKSLPTFSATDLLDGKIPPEALRDRIVLVGGTAAEYRDSFHTPFSPLGDLPGVELHGHLLENLFSGILLREVSGPTWWAILLLTASVASFFVHRVGTIAGGIVLSLVGVACLPLALLLFVNRMTFINPFDLWATLAVTWTSVTFYDSYRLRNEKNQLAKLFRQYVSPHLLQELLEHPESIARGGARRQAVILFADVRGFTTICEESSPEHVISFLNTYFNAMTKVIFRFEGVIDKFMGDGLMAFFGVPLFHDHTVVRAVEAALAMQQALVDLQQMYRQQGEFPIRRIGIGIHGGDVVVGNVGSDLYQEYTVLGDAVNVAARLESQAMNGGILISGWIKDHLPADRFSLRSCGALKVKGRKGEVEAYEVTAITTTDVQ